LRLLKRAGFYTSPADEWPPSMNFTVTNQRPWGAFMVTTPHLTRGIPLLQRCGIATATANDREPQPLSQADLVISVTQIHTGTTDKRDPGNRLYQRDVRSFDKKTILQT